MRPNRSKVFGIGLSKTGTTSIASALELLGYKTKDYMGLSTYIPGDLSSIDLHEIDAHDAFTDTPIPSFYRELDAKYPQSKFILTIREMDPWLKSCKKQFTKRSAETVNAASNELFNDLYGCTSFDAEKFKKGYDRFTAGVLNYFKDRESDLLIIDVCAGEGWEKLCPFLGHPIPPMPFPKRNVTRIQWINPLDLVSISRDAGAEVLKVYNIAQRSHHQSGVLEPLKKAMESTHRAAVQLFDDLFLPKQNRDQRRFNRARKQSYTIICERLRQLSAEIPVLSKEHHDTAYSQRRNWHHVWLIDPLEATVSSMQGGQPFTINIALIEAGRPVFGVVYVPLTDTAYYAKASVGSFKAAGSSPPIKLEANNVETEKPAATNLTPGALKLCSVAEGTTDAYHQPEPTMEWSTAAAHAVVKFSGKSVVNCSSKEELVYNKESLVNDPFIVQ